MGSPGPGSTSEDGADEDASLEVAEGTPCENEDSIPFEDEIGVSTMLNFPTAFMIRNMAMAIETGKSFNSTYDLRSAADSSFKDKAVMGLSAVKSLVIRDKIERASPEFDNHEDIQCLLFSLFRRDNYIYMRREPTLELKDIHGAPAGCFVHQLSVLVGSITSLQTIALLWEHTVLELRKLWAEEQPVPRMPLDCDPDLSCCLLHQQIQVINCCISRKKRKAMAKEKLDGVLKQCNSGCLPMVNSSGQEYNEHTNYARISTGEYVLRLGADYPSESLTMLETGERVYFPILQEGPILTEETIRETEEFVLRTGSLGAGCSQLFSDMQAFKAANPGCVLEDFVRWHSPLDWNEVGDEETIAHKDGSSRRGQLSTRMRKGDNLWLELWETAKALPAVEQTPLFDEDLAVENMFVALEDMTPSKLTEQLLHTLLSVGLEAAEAALPDDSLLVKVYSECRDFIVSVHKEISKDNLDEICKVYETIEAIVVHPEEAQMSMHRADEKASDTRSRLKRFLSLNGKNRRPFWKRGAKEEKKSDERPSTPTRVFSSLLDKKANLFSRKNSRPPDTPNSAASSSRSAPEMDAVADEEWTVL